MNPYLKEAVTLATKKIETPTKSDRVAAEQKRLRAIFGELPNERLRMIDGLICEAAYMRITLEDYRADLDKNGYVEMFTQSERTDPYERERPVARLYNTMNKNYQSMVKQMADLLPVSEVAKVDELADYITQSGPIRYR